MFKALRFFFTIFSQQIFFNYFSRLFSYSFKIVIKNLLFNFEDYFL